MRYLINSDKLNILTELDSNRQQELANKYNVTQQAISKIKKRKECYQSVIKSENVARRSRCPSSNLYTLLDSLVFEFIQLLEERNLPVDDKLIKAKALSVAQSLGLNSFVASANWFMKFKKRNDVRRLKQHGESRCVDLEVVENWFLKLPDIVKDFEPDCIYNADESSFYWKALPTSSYLTRGSDQHGIKQSKLRVSVMFCCNRFGGKEKIMIIGFRARPHCFKKFNYDLSTIGVNYKYNSSSYMTSALFNEWLVEWDNRLIEEKKKILLFVDNCPAHKLTADLKNITLIKLPPNTTSHCQPLDCGIIANVKNLYRSKIIQRLAPSVENDINLLDSLKELQLIDGIEMLQGCWFNVKPDTIVNCYTKAGFPLN
ncbi:tigger transposable element-derived protein 6-like [Panonychus citri]|uniref:tigger transposable element-derived protein 6-like n=1 Tax=Panonychus citri TaxID=50023 RepID=UPI0023081BC5|nr:tigger transposable element-derived protein 6-like [Panonychus citri]